MNIQAIVIFLSEARGGACWPWRACQSPKIALLLLRLQSNIAPGWPVDDSRDDQQQELPSNFGWVAAPRAFLPPLDGNNLSIKSAEPNPTLIY